jgi:DNA-binding NarL/FixJ family response regulator
MSAPQEKLTPRQLQVRDALLRGLTNKEVAKELGILPRTVEDYRGTVLQKYGVRNLVQLMRAVFDITEDANV